MSATMLNMAGEVVGQAPRVGLRRNMNSNGTQSFLDSNYNKSRSSKKMELSNKVLDMLMNDLVAPKNPTRTSVPSKEPNSKRGWGRGKKKPEIDDTLDGDSESLEEEGRQKYKIAQDSRAAGSDTTKKQYLSRFEFSLESAGAQSQSSFSLQLLQGKSRAVASSLMGKLFKSGSIVTSRSDGDLKGSLRANTSSVNPCASGYVKGTAQLGSGAGSPSSSSFKQSRSGSSLHYDSGGDMYKNSQEPSSLRNEPMQPLLSASRKHVVAASARGVLASLGDRDEHGAPSTIAQSSLSRRDQLSATRGGWTSSYELRSSSRRSGTSSSARRREDLSKSQNRLRSSRDLVGRGGGGASRSRSSSSNNLELSSSNHQPRRATKESSSHPSSKLNSSKHASGGGRSEGESLNNNYLDASTATTTTTSGHNHHSRRRRSRPPTLVSSAGGSRTSRSSGSLRDLNSRASRRSHLQSSSRSSRRNSPPPNRDSVRPTARKSRSLRNLNISSTSTTTTATTDDARE
jgi:hypothetical protein